LKDEELNYNSIYLLNFNDFCPLYLEELRIRFIEFYVCVIAKDEIVLTSEIIQSIYD